MSDTETIDLRVSLKVEKTRDEYNASTGRYDLPGLRVEVTPCNYRRVDRFSGALTPCGFSHWEDGGHLEGLGSVAYLDRADDGRVRLTGHGAAEYLEIHRCGLERLEGKVRFLRTVTKRLEKMSERYGYPQDFAAWMPRFAEAIGCKAAEPFVTEATDARRELTGNRWQTMTADQLRRWIDEILEPFKPEPADEDCAYAQ